MDRKQAAKDVQKRFGEKFGRKAGVIEGGDGTTVRLQGIVCSLFCTGEREKEYGCPAGQTAILAGWVPVDASRGARVTFPRTFERIPVYYKRGSTIFAL